MSNGYIPPEAMPLIVDDTSVDAAVTNEPIRALISNVDYLYRRMQLLDDRQAIFLHDQPVDPALKPGQAVYFSKISSRFEGALASTQVLQSMFITDPQGYPWGIIYSNTNGLAIILVNGMAEIDMTNAISGPIETGLYYLSGSETGKLVKQEPPISLPMAYLQTRTVNNTFRVFVNVRFNDLILSHKHYKFDIPNIPAGDYNPVSGLQNEDTDISGWLKADNPVFNGMAPAGAVYGYNITAPDSTINNIWPAIPISTVNLSWTQSSNMPESSLTLAHIPEELCVTNVDGIWWMSDTADYLPWDSTISYNQGVPAGVEGAIKPALTLWYTQVTHSTTNDLVTSLRPKAGAPITITGYQTGQPAISGDLVINADFNVLVDNNGDKGFNVLKNITGTKISRGPVVSGVRSTTLNVAGSLVDTDGYTKGLVTIDTIDGLDGREILFDTVWLDPARSYVYQGIPGIAFDSSYRSSMVGHITIPPYNDTTITVPVTMQIALMILCPATGNIAPTVFKLSLTRVEKTTADNVVTDLNLTPEAVPINVGIALPGGTYPKYYSARSDFFGVFSGEMLNVTVTRDGNDGYPYSLVLIRTSGLLKVQ